MAISILTPPTAEPVSAADAVTQTHLRTEADVDADLVDLYITSAREHAEAATNRQLVTATLILSLDAFPCGRTIEIPRPPLQSVTAVRYYDTAGEQQTLATTAYHVDAASLVGRIVLADGYSWPATQCRPNAVEVEFIAGYGDPADVPAGIKHAILIHTADSYAQRETLIVGTVSSTLSRTVQHLLGPYWVP